MSTDRTLRIGRAAMLCVHSKEGHNGRTGRRHLVPRTVNTVQDLDGRSLRGAHRATKQSRGSTTHSAADCFASLAMTFKTASVLATALLASLVGIDTAPATAATCMGLARLTLPDTTITAVEAVPAGTYTAPDGEVFTNLPGFCRVAAT